MVFAQVREVALDHRDRVMQMPNFVIIGAAKSGTTALYHYLKQHPQIYMSPLKETNFFALEGQQPAFCGPGDQRVNQRSITRLDVYLAQFAGVTQETAVGEASTLYLYSPRARERIQHYVPDAKLIAILRNPVDRAFSAYMHLVRDGHEPLTDFAQALREESNRIQNNWQHLWHYKQMGFYYKQLRQYFETFGEEQIRVFLYDDLKKDPVEVLKAIFGFLNVDTSFTPHISSVVYNVSGIPKNKTWHTIVSRPNLLKTVLKPFFPYKLRRRLVISLMTRNLTRPRLTPEMRQQLVEVYHDDILRLQELLQRDLSKWLQPSSA